MKSQNTVKKTKSKIIIVQWTNIKIRNKTRILTLTATIFCRTTSPGQSYKERKRNSGSRLVRKEVKLSLFIDDRILRLEKQAESTERLSE